MNFGTANIDPIANVIQGLGTGFANNALKKIQIDRQLGKDIYDAARTEAATNLARAKTKHQELETQNLSDMSSLFNPETYTPGQLSAMGAGAKLGTKSLNDIMKSAGEQQAQGFRADLYGNGDPATRLMVGLDKIAPVYEMDNRTGGVLNRFTGSVNINPALANAAAAANAASGGSRVTPAKLRLASPAELETVFEDVVTETDIYNKPVRRKVRNQRAMDEFVSYCRQTGTPMTAENAMAYRAGLLRNDPQSAIPSARAAQPAPAQADPQSVVAGVVGQMPSDAQAYISNLLADWRDGKLNDVELEQLLQETGYFK